MMRNKIILLLYYKNVNKNITIIYDIINVGDKMKSIFVLCEYGLSYSTTKKLYDLNINYIDVEFFKYDFLIEKGFSKKLSNDIMKSLNESLYYNTTNSIYDLSVSGLSRLHLNLLIDKGVTFNDIENLDFNSFSKKYGIKNKVYSSIIDAYNILKSNNYNIKELIDTSKYLLKKIKECLNNRKLNIEQLKKELEKTTYPINNMKMDLVTLKDNNIIKIKDDTIIIDEPSIIEKLEVIDARRKDIIMRRLNGGTLQEIGDYYGLTRERIRQIISKVYNKISPVYEDIFKDLYEKYEFSEEQFTTIFNQPKTTYYYLFDSYKKGNLEYSELENELWIDDDMLIRLRSLNNEICINNEFIRADRIGALKYYFRHNCKDEMYLDDIYHFVNDFITNDLSEYNIEPYESTHNLEAILSRKRWCISGNKNKYRYYEIDMISKNDINKLFDMLNVNDGLYSSLFFFENNLDLMEELDIRNEQELHNILRNTIELDRIKYLRMPNIMIGYETKEDFFNDLFKEYSPISIDDFLKILREKYGHREDTMTSFILSEFSNNIVNNCIVANIVELPDSIIMKLKNKLTKTIYSTKEIKNIFNELELKDPMLLLNRINLSKINYTTIGDFLIRSDYSSLDEAIYNGILNGEIDHSFVNVNNSTAYIIINKMERDNKIIEIDNKYYPYDYIYKLGVDRKDLMKFLDEVQQKFSISKYFFTAKIVREKIKNCILKNDKITDSIINSLIKNINGFRRIIWHDNVILYYNNDIKLSRVDFLDSFIKNNYGITVEELSNRLLEEYGIVLNKTQLMTIIYKLEFKICDGLIIKKECDILI